MGTRRHKRYNPVETGGIEVARITVVSWIDNEGAMWNSIHAEDAQNPDLEPDFGELVKMLELAKLATVAKAWVED